MTVADGHNGCDTRNDILRRDLGAVEIKPGSNGCVVLGGTFHDPYTDATVEFQRGDGTSSKVQIDHVVALSDAWQKGAQQWDAATLRNFANDPINLQATIGSFNQQKGDGDAATWLPPNKSYRCTYVSRIVDVKSAYGLWVTQAEHDAIARILSDCDTAASAPNPTETPTTASVEPPAPQTHRNPSHRPLSRRPKSEGACTTPIASRQSLPVQLRCTPGSPDTGQVLTVTATASPASRENSRLRCDENPRDTL